MGQIEQTLFYQDAAVEGPEWLKEAAQAKANFAQRIPGTADWAIGSGVGSLAQLTPQEREEKKREESEEWADAMMEIGERQEKREREFSETWLKSKHSYAGQNLSGADWKALMDWFDDTENAAAWEDAMIAKTGKSREEVQRIKGKVQRHMELIEKDANGTMTATERTEFAKLDQDKDVRTSYKVMQERMGASMDRDFSREEMAAQTVVDKTESVSQRGNLIAARAEMNAEPITAIYNAAAKAPLDDKAVKAAPTPDAAPVQTTQTPVPPKQIAAMTANLDMG